MPGTRRDGRRKHEAVAYVTANDKPWKFYGGCVAGDFTAEPRRDTQDAARADVAQHLVEVSRQPHIAFVTMVPDQPHGYLGFCLAGDFSPGLVRASRAEAEADVAPHLASIGLEAGTLGEERLPQVPGRGVGDAGGTPSDGNP